MFSLLDVSWVLPPACANLLCSPVPDRTRAGVTGKLAKLTDRLQRMKLTLGAGTLVYGSGPKRGNRRHWEIEQEARNLRRRREKGLRIAV